MKSLSSRQAAVPYHRNHLRYALGCKLKTTLFFCRHRGKGEGHTEQVAQAALLVCIRLEKEIGNKKVK